MTENPYSELERAIAAAIAEIRSLRDQRSSLQAHIVRLEECLAVPAASAVAPPAPEPRADVPSDVAESSERLQQLENEREAIRSRLLNLQTRLGYLGSAEPEDHQNDRR